MAFIAIILLQNHKNLINMPYFLALLKKIASMFPWIKTKVSTSKKLHFMPFPFSSLNFENNSSFLATTFFGFFPLLPTLVGYTLFFEVGWLNSSSLISTILLILSTKFECCENKIGACSLRNFASLSLQRIFVCEG